MSVKYFSYFIFTPDNGVESSSLFYYWKDQM